MNQTAVRSFGNSVINRARDYYSILKKEVNSYYSENLSEDLDLKDCQKEKSLFYWLLWISSVAFASKAVHHLAQRGWLTAVISGIGVMVSIPHLLWSSLLSFYGMSLPLSFGVAMAVIMWYTVFLDSYIPGVYSKYAVPLKTNSFHPTQIHKGYFVAIVNTAILALLLYFG